jgi:hypothetical protein
MKLSHASHQTWLSHNGCRAAVISEILRKIKSNITITLFFFLKEYFIKIFFSKFLGRLKPCSL